MEELTHAGPPTLLEKKKPVALCQSKVREVELPEIKQEIVPMLFTGP